MTDLDNRPGAPDTLLDDGRALWDDLTTTYTFDPHELPLLESLCVAWDALRRVNRALAALDDDELFRADRDGDVRRHPAHIEARGWSERVQALTKALAFPDSDDNTRAAAAAERRSAAARANVRQRWNRSA